MRTRLSGRPGSSFKHFRPRSLRSLMRMPCSSSPTGSKRGSARSVPGVNGSSRGARSPARLWPSAHAGNAGRHRRRFCAASVFRTGARLYRLRGRWRRATSLKRSQAITSSTRCGWRWTRPCAPPNCSSRWSGSREPAGLYRARRQPGGKPGDRRVGVVWHTQGSGKSLTMAFYAGRIIREPAMENPTLVVLTDRNDLDDQLFGTFSPLPRSAAADAGAGREPRASARFVAQVAAGGVVFTTIQKFLPEEKGDRHTASSPSAGTSS